MKTRIATALSVVGVLGAGSAAALVNTQILDGAPAESSASAAVLPPASTIDISIPEVPDTTLAPDTTIEPQKPSTEPIAPAAVELPAPAPAPTGFLTAFNVGEAGVVTIDVIDGQIILISAEAKDGWEVTRTEQPADEHEVEVYFRSGTTEVEFEASLIDGQIVPKVSSRTLGGATTQAGTVTNGAPSNTIAGSGHEDDDHDEDEHHEDDDHEDDDHEDDDHEERDDD